MTQAVHGFDDDDVEAMTMYDAALAEFTDALNRLHIEFGAPTYSQIVKASERPKLSRAGINEVLAGKRLPSLDALIEFVRVVTNSAAQTRGTAPGHTAHPERVGEWRERWRDVKYRQREVQGPARRVRRATKALITEALAEAESVRAQAHEQAERIQHEAQARADHESSQARQDAVAVKQQADELWSRLEHEVQELRQRTQDESARILQDADKRAEDIVRMANDRLSEAEARAQEILQQARDSNNWLPTVKRSEALRTLRDTAQDVARRQLPELINVLSQTNPQDVDLSVTSVGTFSSEEINQVARAFDDVHREAVRLAAEQALLRGNVNAMFTNLSRRSQRLIQRQLSLISELESREADPDLRDALFKLDHLATRMRRNGENLLVLAGEEPGRRWTRPVPLVDVLPRRRLRGGAVRAHRAGLRADHRGRRPRGQRPRAPPRRAAGERDFVLLAADEGQGHRSRAARRPDADRDPRHRHRPHPEDLAAINERLASPPTVDVSVSRRMGLFLAGYLAQRHGIRIQLRPSATDGTTALVMLPGDVVEAAAAPQQGPTG